MMKVNGISCASLAFVAFGFDEVFGFPSAMSTLRRFRAAIRFSFFFSFLSPRVASHSCRLRNFLSWFLDICATCWLLESRIGVGILFLEDSTPSGSLELGDSTEE